MRAFIVVSLLAAIDLESTTAGLGDLARICKADQGAMWGVSLCGPTVVVDRETREAVTWKDGKIESTTLPETVGIANTAAEWKGERWTMLMAPLPEDEFDRRRLLAHESFHRVQESLGFPATGPSNAHLDSLQGRYWMRLEWRALARALAGEAGRKEAIADALTFRAKRRALIATAASEERALEMHEGLAEYTGVALAERDIAKRGARLAASLAQAERMASLVRTFAYNSGPAWGTLIEIHKPRWTRSLEATHDLGDLARVVWNIGPVNPAAAEERAKRHDGATLLEEETLRSAARANESKMLRARYVEAPHLVLPLTKFDMQFDPNGLTPLEGAGTIYRSITLTDAWGRIEVTRGALLSADFQRLHVPLDGGYELTLNEGWALADGEREGERTVVRRQ